MVLHLLFELPCCVQEAALLTVAVILRKGF
jgi:hypothetical protein